MKNILEQFAYGNIDPNDGDIGRNRHYKNVIAKISECENKLKSVMPEETQALYEQLMNVHDEAHAIAMTDKFICGYRLGVLMTTDVFVGGTNAIFYAGVQNG